jgi:hypothetical protein
MSGWVARLQRVGLDACASVVLIGAESLALAGAARMWLARPRSATPELCPA